MVWGSTYLAIRVAVRTIPPLEMAAARYLIAGAVLFPLARRGTRRGAGPRSSKPSLRQWAGMALIGTMLLAFGNGGVSYAEQALPSGLAALLVASVPLWMTFAERVIIRHRRRPVDWLPVLIGLIGVAVLARPRGHGALLPTVVVLGASISWGVGSVLADRMPAPVSPLLGSAMEMLCGGAVLIGLAAATGELTTSSISQVSAQSLLALTYLVGPGSLLGLTCYVIALRRLPVSTVSTYAYVNPVVAVALGALVLGEPLSGTAVLGGAVVIASVAVLLTTGRATRNDSPTDVDHPHPAEPRIRPPEPDSPGCLQADQGADHGH